MTSGKKKKEKKERIRNKRTNRVHHCTFSACVTVLWSPGNFDFHLNTATAHYFTCLCSCFGIIIVFNFIICQNVVCLNPKGDQVVIEHIFEVMKIQYSQNHRDLEGEQAMKTKQSLKWHPECILDLINLSRINDILWSS